MSAATLTNTCAACGAEESLDALLARMVDDVAVRKLIADVIATSLPLGAGVLRYMRLHKPPKQKLRMDKVAKLLGELVPDITRNVIERNGRLWSVTPSEWVAGFQACFDAAAKGALTLPLEGNGYLYGALMRMADKAEGRDEKHQEQMVRGRSYQAGGSSVGEALAGMAQGAAAAPATGSQPPAPRVAPPSSGPRMESPTVRAMKAEIAAKAPKTTNDLPTEERTSP